jgi:ribosomal protein S8
MSKPGKRIYFNTKQIWKISSNKTFIIFSTHKGLKSIHECKKQKIGGEPIVIIK